METTVKWLLAQAQAHPTIAAWLAGIVAVAVVFTNGLRFVWPTYTDMPLWARFVVGCLDPLAGNFWYLAKSLDPDIKGEHKLNGEPNGPA